MKMTKSTLFYQREVKTCLINQTIDSDDFAFGSVEDISVEKLDVSDNRQVKFLPKNVGENLPSLAEFIAERCGLTIVQSFYFKSMRKLQKLSLSDNRIATIEAKSFDDLISLKTLMLQKNRIETIDEKLFVALVNLKSILLNDNKIKRLGPKTFKIPGRQLRWVNLWRNVCIDKLFRAGKLNELEADLRANCMQ